MSQDSDNLPSKPSSQEPPLTDHAYDGIREYDNPLPGWWTYLYVGTVIFSILYFYTAITTGELSAEHSYQQAQIEDTARQFGSIKLKPDAETLLGITQNDKLLAMGSSIFQTNCVSCHGRHAEGLACPNLTDDSYIHIKKIEDFPDVISKGRNNGAMPAWGNRLSPNEVIVVAGYVASLRGTNYPGGKKAEGTVPPPWSAH